MKTTKILFLFGVLMMVGSAAAFGLIALLYGPAVIPWIQITINAVTGAIALFASAVPWVIETLKKAIRRK